jgi:hypothetical protein
MWSSDSAAERPAERHRVRRRGGSPVRAPREASAATRARAIAYIERLAEGGGTDIALALRTALSAQHEGKRPRVVLFLTDGKSSAPEAVKAVDDDRRDARVFTVGIGEGVNVRCSPGWRQSSAAASSTSATPPTSSAT